MRVNQFPCHQEDIYVDMYTRSVIIGIDSELLNSHIHMYVNMRIHMHVNSVNHIVGFLFAIAQLLVHLLLATVSHSFFLHYKSSRSAKFKWKYEKMTETKRIVLRYLLNQINMYFRINP